MLCLKKPLSPGCLVGCVVDTRNDVRYWCKVCLAKALPISATWGQDREFRKYPYKSGELF